MAENAALLVDEVLPEEPMRQLTAGMACSRAMQEQLLRVLSFPYSFVLPVRQPTGDHGSAAGHRLPLHSGFCRVAASFNNIFM